MGFGTKKKAEVNDGHPLSLKGQMQELSMDIPKRITTKLASFLHSSEEIFFGYKGVFGTHSRWTDSSVRTSSRRLSGSKVEGAGTQWGHPG